MIVSDKTVVSIQIFFCFSMEN